MPISNRQLIGLDRIKQKQFKLFWRPGILNQADYHTKQHPTKHHKKMRPTFLHVSQKTAFFLTALKSYDKGVLSHA